MTAVRHELTAVRRGNRLSPLKRVVLFPHSLYTNRNTNAVHSTHIWRHGVSSSNMQAVDQWHSKVQINSEIDVNQSMYELGAARRLP